MRVVAANQMTLELQPGLLQRFSTLRQCVYFVALNYQHGMKNLAADCDLSESELTRRLSPSEGDPRSCDVNLMVKIIAITNNTLPIQWLLARFVGDDDTRKGAAVHQLASMMPLIASCLADAGYTVAPAAAGKKR